MNILFSPVRARSSALDLESNASWEPQIRRKGHVEARKSKVPLFFLVIVFTALVSMSCFALMHTASGQEAAAKALDVGAVGVSWNAKGLVAKAKAVSGSRQREDELAAALQTAALKDRKARVSAPQLKQQPKNPNKQPGSSSRAPGSGQQSGAPPSHALGLRPPVDGHVTGGGPGATNVSFPSAGASSCMHNYGPALHDCDHWVRTQGNTCALLTAENGFDCQGCLCDAKALVEAKGCTDYGGELKSCDYWLQLNVGQTCRDLEQQHHFDCSGCRCHR